MNANRTVISRAARRAGAPVGEDEYRAYTSRDGVTWVRGGVRTHDLGADASIGLVSMGGAGFTASFDYVRTFELAAAP